MGVFRINSFFYGDLIMPRVKVEVDRDELQKIIGIVEKNGPLKNRSALWQAVSETKWAKSNGVPPSVALLRFEEYGLTCQTTMGKRGRTPGESRDAGPAPESPRTVISEPKRNVLPPVQRKPADVPPDFFEPFTSRGLTIECLEDLVTSTSKTDEENVALWEGWQEVIMHTHGSVVRKEQYVAMYERLGKPVPKSIQRLVDRDANGNRVIGDGIHNLNPRIEMSR